MGMTKSFDTINDDKQILRLLYTGTFLDGAGFSKDRMDQSHYHSETTAKRRKEDLTTIRTMKNITTTMTETINMITTVATTTTVTNHMCIWATTTMMTTASSHPKVASTCKSPS